MLAFNSGLAVFRIQFKNAKIDVDKFTRCITIWLLDRQQFPELLDVVQQVCL